MFDALTARRPRRGWRTLLLIGSLVAHAAAGVGALAWAMWKIELLIPERMAIDVVRPRQVALEPEAPAAASPAPQKPKAPIKHPVTEPRQPTATPPPPTPDVATGTGNPDLPVDPLASGGGSLEGCADPPCDRGPAPEPVVVPVAACGDGTKDAGEECDDGNTVDGDRCSRACRVEVRQVPPRVIDGLRVSGEAQILPPSTVQTQMARDGVVRAVGVFKVCLDTVGRVEQVRQLRSTGFPDYDQRLDAGIRQWRYRPYEVDGRAVPACGTVQFVYQQR
jgi:cysteine-rich repeat protein